MLVMIGMSNFGKVNSFQEIYSKMYNGDYVCLTLHILYITLK